MRMQRLFIVYTILVGAMMTASCSDDEKDKDEADSTESGVVGNGTAGQSGQGTHLASEATDNIGTVEANMLPGSLAINTGTTANLTEDNPCAGTDGFFDCQPNLLKLYMSLAKQMVGQTNAMVTEISTGLFSHMEPPTDGVEICETVSPDDGQAEQIQYCVTSESRFSILIDTALGPFLFLDVDGTKYEIKGNMANSVEEEGGEGEIHALIDFTSATDFDVEVRLLNMGCSADDIRAPNSIVVKVDRSDDVWQGKAMLYSGRWLFDEQDGVTCTTDPTDELAVTIYTDFVGDDTKASAALYVMPRTVTSVADIAAFPASAFCDSFSGACFNGYGFGDQNPIASYGNDFCVTDGEATWNAACTDDNSLIATPTYLPASDFITPSDLSTLSLDMPEEL